MNCQRIRCSFNGFIDVSVIEGKGCTKFAFMVSCHYKILYPPSVFTACKRGGNCNSPVSLYSWQPKLIIQFYHSKIHCSYCVILFLAKYNCRRKYRKG